jgi:hypothetical protein
MVKYFLWSRNDDVVLGDNNVAAAFVVFVVVVVQQLLQVKLEQQRTDNNATKTVAKARDTTKILGCGWCHIVNPLLLDPIILFDTDWLFPLYRSVVSLRLMITFDSIG